MITHLVDSDWLLDYLRNNGAALRVLRPLIQQGSVSISVITYAEVREGILGGQARDAGFAALRDFTQGSTVLDIDREIADVFAQLRLDLRRRGEPLADHDLWIATTALRYNLVLLSRDRHFERIASLKRA